MRPLLFAPCPRIFFLAATTAMASMIAPASAEEQEKRHMLEAPDVNVVGSTPIPGLGTAIDQVPANVQTRTHKDITREQSVDLPDFMDSTIPSVNLNNITGNQYQQQLNYRGFAASPLLGEPQGLSVYQDGVRINQPFGDTVSWDQIPLGALAAVDVMPGSNPLFGLNTLGGAIALRTKSGRDFPTTAAQAYYGSFETRAFQAETGGKKGDFDYYIFGNAYKDNGWRDFSPSTVNQFFAKIGWESGGTDIDLSVTRANNSLIGNGLVPQSFLDQGWRSNFTIPDQTVSSVWLTNLSAGHWIADDLLISGNAYYATNDRNTKNGDINDGFEEDPAVDGAEGANGGLGFNQDTGANNRTSTSQHGWGGALLFTLAGKKNNLQAGATYDQSSSGFFQTTALGTFGPNRAVVEEDAAELENSLDGSTKTWSLLATDTYTLLPKLNLIVSGRYNHTQVTTTDRLNPVPPNLDGDFTYTKFNPAGGITYSPLETLNLFGGWSQGNRAPTPIELGCADPNNPCTLPAGLQSDPYLNQVVAQTWEIGARGMVTNEIRWNAAWFQTNNSNDILFVGTTTSAGFFTNFGRTRRQGLEIGFNGSHSRFRWAFNYSFIDATFQSSACLLSENNSSRGTSPACTDAAAGTGDDLILVNSGNQMPGIPKNQFRLWGEYQVLENWWIGGTVLAFTDQYVRGNENNQHRAGTFTDLLGDTRTFTGPGTSGGYAVVNLTTRFRPHPRWELFARLTNIFDRKYTTAGALAENPFNAAGTFQTNSDDWTRATFYAPGQPFGAWVGIRFLLDRPLVR